jgi:hypothetical protein
LRVSNTDDFDFFADLDNSALDTAGHDSAAEMETRSTASGRHRPLRALAGCRCPGRWPIS